MAHLKFQEYLDRNNKLQTSGKVKQIADFDGKVDTKPTKEKKHKDAGGKGQDGEMKPYKGGTDGKDPNKGKLGDGFAHKGDAKLKYTPKTTVPAKVGEGGNKKATWPKTETQAWIDKTKGMSLAEFTKTVREDSLKGLSECACQEAPHNSIKETVSVCKCNQKYVSALVREMKRNGMFGKLFAEMTQHPEAYKVLAKLMERDESYSRRLVNALNEFAGPPMDMGDMGGPPMAKKLPLHKKKKPMPPMDDMGGDMGDEDMPPPEDEMGDEGDDLGLDVPAEDDDELGDMGHDDMGDEEMGDDMGDEDMPPPEDDMGDMGDMGDDMGDDMPPPPHDKIGKLPPPKKKKHGIDHLLGAMKNHPAMQGGM